MQQVNPLSCLDRNQKLRLLSLAATNARQQRKDASLDIVERYRNDEIAFITEGLGQLRDGFPKLGDSWQAWRIILKAAYGKPLDLDELAQFREIAKRNPPNQRVKELWLIVGRRGGKDSVASMIACQAACYADEGVALRPGEHALVACFATNRDQAGIVYRYTKAYFETNPSLRKRVVNINANTIVLNNFVQIAVTTSSYRAPRGWPIACAIFDEVAFWMDENSANPDTEIYQAVLGGANSNTMIVGISTPYRQAGLLYDRWKKFHGKDDQDVLVIQAPTLVLHPTFDQSIIQRQIEQDPERARAEYYAEWRRDVAAYVLREVVEACTVKERYELPRQWGISYKAFVDPSGGSIDSMTLAIAHKEGRGKVAKGVLDLVREVRAPFAPESVVIEFSQILKSYGISRVKGDHYGGEWPRERFAFNGITYEVSELSKSDIYREFLPHLNTQYVELLDVNRLTEQLCALERRTVRGGRDSVDHPPDAYDDLINAAAGALLSVMDGTGLIVPTASQLEQSRIPRPH